MFGAVHMAVYGRGVGAEMVEVVVLQVTHHGGDDYDKMIKGDPGLESIFNWTKPGPSVAWRGATGKGDGVHILTGQLSQSNCWTVAALVCKSAPSREAAVAEMGCTVVCFVALDQRDSHLSHLLQVPYTSVEPNLVMSFR